MAVCPKCGKKLKITDISQYCPSCGVNMRFYGFEERFFNEAKHAELAFAGWHVRFRHLKAAFIGSKLTKARLIVMLLPVLSLLVPAANVTMNLPYRSDDVSLGLMGLVNVFSGDVFNYINSMTGAALSGGLFSAYKTALFCEAGVAVFAVLAFLLSLLCFISVKNMQKITSIASFLGILMCCITAWSLFSMKNIVASSSTDIFIFKIGFGLIITAIMFAVVAAVNLLIVKKGIPIEYEEGDLERVEIAKKVKAGVLNIDDLPQPVVETAATRAIDEEIAKEEAAFNEKHGDSVKEVLS